MKKIAIFILILCLLIGINVFANNIQVDIIQRNIMYNGERVATKYPILSYDDITYISLRDTAKMVSKNIRWEEEYNKIEFDSPKTDAIKNQGTGEAIGKAILKEFYDDRITDDTICRAGAASQSLCFDDVFTLAVIFEPEGNVKETDDEYDLYVLNNCDICINVSTRDGSVYVDEVQEDGTVQRMSLVELSRRNEGMMQAETERK